MTPHIHAKAMAEYAKDAAEIDNPWSRWERLSGDGTCISMRTHPMWVNSYHYQRKPRLININGHQVTEPCRVALETGQTYYVVASLTGRPSEQVWEDDRVDMTWLEHGLLHLTKEAAEAHLKALLSFTAKEEQ